MSKSTRHAIQANPDEKSSLLVVDDNEMNRDLMALQFQRAGHGVMTAESGYQALEMIKQHHFDLILLDVMMPGMSGLEVLATIRLHHSLINLPVIMVTADDLEQNIVKALELGANDYIVKPLSIPIALARINTQLTLGHLAKLKDEFLRFASHDLKKPLIVMRDITETLCDEIKSGNSFPEDAVDLLNMVNKTGDHMQQVIEGFLHHKADNPEQAEQQFKEISLNDIAKKCLQANRQYARKKQVILELELDPEPPTAEGDPFRLAQVLDNLIGNALKFSPPDTVTTVSTRHDEENIYAEISDGGPGLTQDDMGLLFTRYASLSNKPTGNEHSSGIGLNMSKMFIEMHHGIIGAYNNDTREQGKTGATFWFSIPRPDKT